MTRDLERPERDDEWRAKCHGLSSSVEAFKKSLAETQENLVKTQLSVSGLTEMNGQLKLDNDDLRSGVETRDEALAILREEYEKLKARYRKKSQVWPLNNSLYFPFLAGKRNRTDAIHRLDRCVLDCIFIGS